MNEMVDRICDLLMAHGCGDSEQCERIARAVITAMRDATDAMMFAGAKALEMEMQAPSATLMGIGYFVMTDAALAKPSTP